MNCQRIASSCMAILVLAWLALSGAWLWGGLTIPYDAKAHFQPQLQFLANSLHSGQSPFWNPHVFGGSPQIADPQSLIFSPALLLAALFPAPGFLLLDVYVLLLLAGAAIAILLHFKDRGWHPAGAMVAALAFAFGASAAWRAQHVGQIQSLALFAIALWLLHRCLLHRTLTSSLLAGLACGTLLLEPNQVSLLAAYTLACYALCHVLGRPEPLRAVATTLPALSLAAAVSLLISVVPMLMLMLFAAGTSRPEIAFSEAARGSLHPASLLTFLIGDLYAAGTRGIDYWGPYSETWSPNNLTLSQNMSQLYIGALPILAILAFGVVRGLAWAREIRFFSLATLVMILYALGTYTPAFRVLYDIVPGVDLFRRPADATFMIGGLSAILAGYLVHRAAQQTTGDAKSHVPLLTFATIATIFAIAVAVAIREGALAKALAPLAASAGLLLAAGACIWAARQHELAPVHLSIPLIAALMTIDLAAINGPNESTALPLAQFDVLRPETRNETIALLTTRLAQPPGSPRRDRVELAGVGFDWPNAGMVHRFDHTLGYNPLRLAVVSEALGADDTIAGWDQRRFTPLFPSYRSHLADMMGLRYLVAAVPASRIDKRLKPGDLRLIARTKDAYIYVNPRALPRAIFVPDWQPADFTAMTRTGKWPAAFDPRQTLLLESAPRPPISPRTTAPPSIPATAATVRLRRYHNTVVEIDVDAPRPGFVLLNDVWHPWWRATMDDAPAPILKANVMFRAVAVPAGRHSVRFSFEPVRGMLDELNDKRKSTPPPKPPEIAAPRL